MIVEQDKFGMTDGELLQQFVDRGNEAAFESLVRQHGKMVFAACLRVLRNVHDAEDAFQATFLVLARKASTIVPRDQVGNWLLGVAWRTALKARVTLAKKNSRETPMHPMPEPYVMQPPLSHSMVESLERELNRFPDKYRLPVILCCLEGKTQKEAAIELGWPEGTVSVRLMKGKQKLSARLQGQGAVLSGVAVAAFATQGTLEECIPSELLLISTVKAATHFAADRQAYSQWVSSNVVALTEGVLKSMAFSKFPLFGGYLWAALVAGLAVSFGAGGQILKKLNAEPNSRIISEAEPAVTRPTQLAVGLQQPVGKKAKPSTSKTAPKTAPRKLPLPVPQALKQFSRDYQPEAGRAVRHIPLPFPPSRLAMIRTDFGELAQRFQNGTGMLLVSWTKDKKHVFHIYPAEGGTRLDELLINLCKIPIGTLHGDEELLNRRVTGDFNIRSDASRKELLADLQPILSRELKAKIVLTEELTITDLFVARGNFKLSDIAAKRGIVVIEESPIGEFDSIEEAVRAGRKGQSNSADLSAILEWMARVIKIPIVNETKQVPPTSIPHALMMSKTAINDYPPQPFLDSFANQTGLTITRETRRIPTVRVVISP